MAPDEGRRGTQEADALKAAFACFARNGLRHTSMEDIARELGRSRPVVYRYFTDKNDAFRAVAGRILAAALDVARERAAADGAVADRVYGVVSAKLELAIRVNAESPHHAREILAEDSGVIAEQVVSYIASLQKLIVGVLAEHTGRARAREIAEILIALTRGLEQDLTHPKATRARLRLATDLICRDIPTA
ncbi:TetR family transcriptional regulator [Epidermidibacterium keratini]|uniref:TetR family transcriptional regulator n=1 Tax=Epidermidibacterium keratini TaxID=1891644 RepID=A0A7L4YQA2_9ACTN|nr:TetR/AcrR family transcriptional regulator [Epidermidibacterium keratini]QHC01202.1 TetR family transcriptional regulator [Epidermidibacterium keratini]